MKLVEHRYVVCVRDFSSVFVKCTDRFLCSLSLLSLCDQSVTISLSLSLYTLSLSLSLCILSHTLSLSLSACVSLSIGYNLLSVLGIVLGVIVHPPASKMRGMIMHTAISLWHIYYLLTVCSCLNERPPASKEQEKQE